MATRILDGLILTIPSYLPIELLVPGLYERFEAWMYELVRAVQVGKSYPSEAPMEFLNSSMTMRATVMVLDVLYQVLPIAGSGATLGKMVMRTHVTRADDPSTRTPRFVRALAQALTGELIGCFDATLLFLSIFTSYLMPLFTKKEQALHDMTAGTIVVKN